MKAERIRAAVVGGVLLVLLAALALRLYRLQVVEADGWRAIARKQQQPLREVAAYRGAIVSRDGEVLAGSVRARSACAEPYRMGRVERQGKAIRQLPPTPADWAEAARAIAAALNWGPAREERLRAVFSDPRFARFRWIERRLDDERARRLLEEGVRGVFFRDEYRRVYPAGGLAAQVVGLVSDTRADGELRGLSGVEAMLERELAGVKGLREVLRDGTSRGELLETGRFELPPEDGATVTLTIDAEIQRICEEAAARAAAEWKPAGIAIVALDPRDGRIQALASWPTFHPEARHVAPPPEALRNRTIQDTFEPGSILKPLIAAFAVERRAVSPEQSFDCTSPARFGARRVEDVHSHGTLAFPDVIAQSSNVGMARIAMALGPEGLVAALERCGFGARTGIGLAGEERGQTTPLADWSYHSTISVAQGYELAVTPLQMASAFAALANGGVRMRPQLVERIVDGRGRVVRELRPEEAARIVSAEVACEIMVPALVRVVEEGTGKRARLERWTVAGKTGTAKKVIPGRGYVAGRYRSSFCCFAPAEDPRIVLLVMVDDPASNGPVPYGGTVAAPIAKEILERALPYLRAPVKAAAPPAEER